MRRSVHAGSMAGMKVHLLPPAELDASLTARWRALREAPGAAHAWRSPFFAPEYAQLVGEVRPRSRIAVIELDGEVAGFHALEPSALGLAMPLGGHMSDAHAPLIDPRLDLDPAVWLRACGIRSWRFDHLPAGTPGFDAFESGRVSAWLLRLDKGFAAYRTAVDARSGWIRRTAAKLRRLERQFGPLRFEPHTHDPRARELLAHWKSAQYRRSGLVDNFSIAWVRDYLDRLQEAATPGLSGMMSALYAGDRLAAVHLGMRSERVWHHYLPTFDRELATLSPGLGLLLRMAEHAPLIGIETIDFSSGDMEYKRSASTDCIALAQGAVEPVWLRASRLQARRTVMRLRASPPVLRTARRARRAGVALLNAARSGANALRS